MNIKEYMCSHEECIEMVKEGINQYTKKEIYALMNNHGMSSSISKTIRGKFCGSNIDVDGNVYLFDELNPKKITDYFIGRGYLIREDVLYAYVCQVLMHEINEFYRNLDLYKREEVLAYRLGDKCTKNLKKFYKLYPQAMKKRIEMGYKRIRRTAV